MVERIFVSGDSAKAIKHYLEVASSLPGVQIVDDLTQATVAILDSPTVEHVRLLRQKQHFLGEIVVAVDGQGKQKEELEAYKTAGATRVIVH